MRSWPICSHVASRSSVTPTASYNTCWHNQLSRSPALLCTSYSYKPPVDTISYGIALRALQTHLQLLSFPVTAARYTCRLCLMLTQSAILASMKADSAVTKAVNTAQHHNTLYASLSMVCCWLLSGAFSQLSSFVWQLEVVMATCLSDLRVATAGPG
jgi:hypothetical protein